MKKINRLPSLSRVVPGSKATLELPLGPTYETIVFTVKSAAGVALDVADIGRIDVLFNGQVKQTFKNLQRLIHLNEYWNREVDTITGTSKIEFALHFNRAEMIDGMMRAAPGVGTADLSTLHIELDIAVGAPADIQIEAYALVNPVRQNLGTFYNIKEVPFSSAVAGEVEIDKLIRGPFYSAIHLFKADISDVQVKANDVEIIKATKSILERFQKGASPKARVPLTANATHIDFMTDGNLLQSLPTGGLQDFRIKMVLDTAGAVDIVTETIDTLTV